MNPIIKRFFSRLLKSFARGFDKFLAGTIIKKLFIFTCIFAFCFFSFWIYCSVFHSNYSGKINKEIEGIPRAIIAQMLDPGNQHMVGQIKLPEQPETNAQKPENSSSVKPSDLNDKENRGLKIFVLVVSIIGTLIYSGLLISTFLSIFEQRSAIVREGLMNYHHKKHVVIIGNYCITAGLIKQLLKAGNKKIVLLSSCDAQELRRMLRSKLPAGEMKKIIILYGDRTSSEDLNRLSLPEAKDIFLLGEDDEADHDARNEASLILIETILKEYYGNHDSYSKILECNILFESQTTYAAHQIFNFQKLNADGKRVASPVNINAFSFYEKWAQKVFVGCRHENIIYSPLDFEPVSEESDKYVHLIVAGTTRMGYALAVEAARLGHYANFKRKNTRITFIDSDAENEMNFFAGRYQSFFDAIETTFIDLSDNKERVKKGTLPFINITLSFVKSHFENPALRQKLIEWTSDKNALTTIAICYNDSDKNLAAGLYLPVELYNDRVRILVRQDTDHSLLSIMYPDETKVENRFKNVKPFGMRNDCLDLSLHKDLKAKIVHYFYSYNNLLPDDLEKISHVMDSDWNVLRERFKWSSRYNAESINTKLRAVGIENVSPEEMDSFFGPENIELLAQIEHARWNADTLLAGYFPPDKTIAGLSKKTADEAWAAYLEKDKNDDDEYYKHKKQLHEDSIKGDKKKMIHPCLVSFDNLSEYYKEIDRRLIKCIPLIERYFAEKRLPEKNG